MVTKPTSASPIINAAAVTAVRVGLRTAFSRASRPVIAVSFSMGQPMTVAIGAMNFGLSMATPRNKMPAPRPIKERR